MSLCFSGDCVSVVSWLSKIYQLNSYLTDLSVPPQCSGCSMTTLDNGTFTSKPLKLGCHVNAILERQGCLSILYGTGPIQVRAQDRGRYRSIMSRYLYKLPPPSFVTTIPKKRSLS